MTMRMIQCRTRRPTAGWAMSRSVYQLIAIALCLPIRRQHYIVDSCWRSISSLEMSIFEKAVTISRLVRFALASPLHQAAAAAEPLRDYHQDLKNRDQIFKSLLGSFQKAKGKLSGEFCKERDLDCNSVDLGLFRCYHTIIKAFACESSIVEGSQCLPPISSALSKRITVCLGEKKQ